MPLGGLRYAYRVYGKKRAVCQVVYWFEGGGIPNEITISFTGRSTIPL